MTFLRPVFQVLLFDNFMICIKAWDLNSIGLFEMIVGVLTTCRTQYTSDKSICIFFI